MKKLLLFLLPLLVSFSALAQINNFGGVGYRVNDSTTYRASQAVTNSHAQGYTDIYYTTQAARKHWDVWNGSTYEHIFSFVAPSGGHVIQDEGTPLTQRSTMNYVGAGVTVTDAGGKTVVTIPGGTSAFTALTDGPGSFSGKTLNFTRVDAGETTLEYRTPSQVRSDIGAGVGTVTSVTSANSDATIATTTSTPVITIVSAPKLTTGRTVAITGDLAYTSPSFDGSGNVTAAGTLATVNSNVGSFGSATQSLTATVNAKGLVTAISAQTVTPAVGSITGLGSGIGTFLGTAVGASGKVPTSNGTTATWITPNSTIASSTKTANYTLDWDAVTGGDAGSVVLMSVGSANTLTVPPNSTEAFPLNTTISVTQYGVGVTTVTAGAGVTIRYSNATGVMGGQFQFATLLKIGTDEWLCTLGGVASYSGTFTPTLTNTTNAAASTAYVTGYTVLGSCVRVFGKVDIDATAAGAVLVAVSLPVASNLAAEQDLAGIAASDVGAGTVVRIKGDATNDRASFVFPAVSVTNDSYAFEFSYQIK